MKWLQKMQRLHEEVVGMNQRNHALVYPNNPRKHFTLADDKAATKEVLHEQGIATPETYAVVERIGEIAAALKHIRQYRAVAVKPAMGSGGGGILILKQNEAGEWARPSGKVVTETQLRTHMANILFGMYSLRSSDKVIVEYCLNPHPFFHGIYPHGVPDFRIITLKRQPLLAMLRMPNDQSDGKANLHAGALGIGIDLANGKVLSGYDGSGFIDVHPDTGVRYAGLQIPHWEKTLGIALKTAAAFPLDYLGIDIVFDRDLGPMVIEVNARPGIQIQNVHKTGLKQVIEQLKTLK